MTDYELADLLSRTVANAFNGEKTNAYAMFSIKYAGELGSGTNAVADLARRHWPEAGLKLSPLPLPPQAGQRYLQDPQAQRQELR